MLEIFNDSYRYSFKDCKGGTKKSFLFMSDVHFDSIICDRKLLRKHLNQAKEKGARILIFGDWFDCMGGKYDPRTTKEDIRPEYQSAHYFNDIVNDSVAYLKSYKDNIDMISEGNHETKVKKRHEFDLLGNGGICTLLGIKTGKYAGFINFSFSNNGSDCHAKKLYWTHGGGGNAVVTKGTIKTNRRQDAIQADWFVSAHIHTSFELTRPRATITTSGNVVIQYIFHWQLGCYKNDFLGGGWADHLEFAPACLGGRWVDVIYHKDYLEVISYLAT